MMMTKKDDDDDHIYDNADGDDAGECFLGSADVFTTVLRCEQFH